MAKELLKDVTVRNAKPKDKDQRLNDGDGLYILIKANGAKWWRFDYIIKGKRKTLSVGVYPATGLSDARDKANKARANVANGIDPSDTRKQEKAANKLAIENENRIDAGLTIIDSFEYIAREWYERNIIDKSEKHQKRSMRLFERDIFPYIGSKPVTDIKAVELLAALRRIEERNAIETAHRALQICGQVFRYAVCREHRLGCKDWTQAAVDQCPGCDATSTISAQVRRLIVRELENHLIKARVNN